MELIPITREQLENVEEIICSAWTRRLLADISDHTEKLDAVKGRLSASKSFIQSALPNASDLQKEQLKEAWPELVENGLLSDESGVKLRFKGADIINSEDGNTIGWICLNSNEDDSLYIRDEYNVEVRRRIGHGEPEGGSTLVTFTKK